MNRLTVLLVSSALAGLGPALPAMSQDLAAGGPPPVDSGSMGAAGHGMGGAHDGMDHGMGPGMGPGMEMEGDCDGPGGYGPEEADEGCLATGGHSLGQGMGHADHEMEHGIGHGMGAGAAPGDMGGHGMGYGMAGPGMGPMGRGGPYGYGPWGLGGPPMWPYAPGYGPGYGYGYGRGPGPMMYGYGPGAMMYGPYGPGFAPPMGGAPGMDPHMGYRMGRGMGPEMGRDPERHMRGGEGGPGGQSAFSTIQRIVRRLMADPHTDWSKVDIEALRQHLIDMNNVTLYAEVAESDVQDGARFVVTSDDPKVADSIRRMVPAHAQTSGDGNDWTMSAELLSNGAALTVTGDNPQEIRALGFIGVMTVGSHHGMHHWAMATGQGMQGH